MDLANIWIFAVSVFVAALASAIYNSGHRNRGFFPSPLIFHYALWILINGGILMITIFIVNQLLTEKNSTIGQLKIGVIEFVAIVVGTLSQKLLTRERTPQKKEEIVDERS